MWHVTDEPRRPAGGTPTHLRNLLPAITVALLGLLLTYLAYQFVQRHQHEQARATFFAAAEERVVLVQHRAQEAAQRLESVFGLFAASREVDRDEFDIFVETTFANDDTVHAVEWIPRIRQQDRALFEVAAQEAGFAGFRIRERSPDGEMVAAARRDEYFPVFYVQPYAGNEAAVGFDLASNPARREALTRARDSGEMTATAPITLAQDQDNQAGFLVFRPVYRKGVPLDGIVARRQHLLGFVLGVFRVGALIDSALEDLAAKGIAIHVFDDEAEADQAPLHIYREVQATAGAMNILSTAQNTARSNLEYAAYVETAGRRWRVVAVSTDGYASADGWLPWSTLGVGLLLTGLLTAFVATTTRRRAFAEDIAEERTVELSHANVQLQQEAVEREQAESELDSFFTLSIDLLCIAGFDGFFKHLNPAWENILGFSTDELLKRPFIDFVHEDDRNATQVEAEKLVDGRGTIEFENRYRCKDGSYRWFLWTAAADVERGLIYAVARDITDRRADETRIRTILGTVVDGIITINERGIIETVNPAAESIFGYVANEMIGQNVSMLMPEPYRSEHDGYLNNFRRTGDAKIIGSGREVEGQRKDGSTFPLDLAVNEMWLGSRRMFTGVVRDITERKNIDRMKNEFISTVSHELRTPLTSIRGSLGLVAGGVAGELPEKARSLIDIAANNSDRLVRLINDILDIEKIESGKMVLKKRSIAIAPLIDEAIAANRAFAAQYDVSYRFESQANDMVVYADSDRIMQVLTNLLSNAAKYSPKDGTVDVTLTGDDDEVCIAVADQGAGIPEEFHDSIFQKFSQADASTTREKGGTGLGLSIAKAITEMHDGRLSFETDLGKGTTFLIELPGKHAQVRTAVTSADADADPRHRVLVCEDDPDVARLLQLMLEENGYAVDVSFSAEQADSLLDQRDYAAMTLDLALPGEDGVSFIRRIRQRDAAEQLPIVVVSAIADEGARELNGGAFDIVDWLQKPIDQDRLLASVATAAARSSTGHPRILHVEDDADVLQVTAAVIGDAADIAPATTLREARRQLETDRFDLILLDLALPDGSGIELLEEIRPLVPQPTVIIFSAHEADQETARQVSAVLTKSRTTNEELVDQISRAIG